MTGGNEIKFFCDPLKPGQKITVRGVRFVGNGDVITNCQFGEETVMIVTDIRLDHPCTAIVEPLPIEAPRVRKAPVTKGPRGRWGQAK